jgi:hypothetical protein
MNMNVDIRNNGVGVLLYSLQFDIICNHLGVYMNFMYIYIYVYIYGYVCRIMYKDVCICIIQANLILYAII